MYQSLGVVCACERIMFSFPSLSGLEFRVVAYGYPILSSSWRQCQQFVIISTYFDGGLARLVSVNETLDPPLLVLETSIRIWPCKICFHGPVSKQCNQKKSCILPLCTCRRRESALSAYQVSHYLASTSANLLEPLTLLSSYQSVEQLATIYRSMMMSILLGGGCLGPLAWRGKCSVKRAGGDTVTRFVSHQHSAD